MYSHCDVIQKKAAITNDISSNSVTGKCHSQGLHVSLPHTQLLHAAVCHLVLVSLDLVKL